MFGVQKAREECKDVPKQKERQECSKVQREVCNKVPAEVCEQVAKNVCKQVERQSCKDIPRDICEQVGENQPTNQKTTHLTTTTSYFSPQVPQLQCRKVPRPQCSNVCSPTYFCEVSIEQPTHKGVPTNPVQLHSKLKLNDNNVSGLRAG